MDNSDMTVFCDAYDLKSLITEPACYKNPENPSCIDLILTKNLKCFQSLCVVETSLSDLNNIKQNKNFQNDRYKEEFTPKLSSIVSVNNNIRLNEFLSICMDKLGQYASCKQEVYAR